MGDLLMNHMPCSFCVDIHIVYLCIHQPCHVQKMTIYITPSILQLLYSFGLSFCNSPPAWKGWFRYFTQGWELNSPLFSQHWLVCVSVLSVANCKLKLFWSKMIETFRYMSINRTIFREVWHHICFPNKSFLFSQRRPMTSLSYTLIKFKVPALSSFMA